MSCSPAVRVVRIHLIDGGEVNQHVYRQERWDKSASGRCAPQSTPLRLPLRHNRPLPAPSRLLPPLTSPSRALGTLAKLTSVTEITGYGPGLQLIIRNIALFGQWPVSLGNGVLVRLRSGGLRHFVDG